MIHDYLPLDLLIEKCSDRWLTIDQMKGTLHPYVDLAYRAKRAKKYLVAYYTKKVTAKARKEAEATLPKGQGRPRKAQLDPKKIAEEVAKKVAARDPIEQADLGLKIVVRDSIQALKKTVGVVRQRAGRSRAEYFLSSTDWKNRDSLKNPNRPKKDGDNGKP